MIALSLVLTFSFAMMGEAVQASEYVRVGTAGEGGNYYMLGGAFSTIWNEYFDVEDPEDIPDGFYERPIMSTIQATQGSPHNVELVSTGQVELAFGLAEPVYAGYHHEGQFEDREYLETDNQKFIGYLYPNPYWFVVMDWAEDDIDSLEDVVGHRISVGMTGSSGEMAWREIMDYYGWTYDDVDEQFTVHGEAIDQVRDRRIDVTVWPDAPGSPSYMEIFDTGYANAYSYPEEVIEYMTEGNLREPTTIPAGSVDGQEEEFEAFMDPAIMIANEDLDDEIAYNITKAIYEFQEEYSEIFPLADFLDAEVAHRGQPVPLHDGAAEYYEEIGVLENFEPHPAP